MIDAAHLRQHVIRPALKHLSLWSEAAEDLLLGTAAVESRLGTYLVQVGGGPALSPWQIEPATHADLWINYLRHRPPLRDFVRALAPPHLHSGDPEVQVDADALVASLWYAAAIARLVYRRSPLPLPAAGDWRGMAETWKAAYNTPLGKGTPEKFLQACAQCGVMRSAKP